MVDIQNNISVSDLKTLIVKNIFTTQVDNSFVATNPDPDTIELHIYDSENNQQGPVYNLTSNPAIQYVPSTKAYYIEIDVTNFPDGNITAIWTASLDSTPFHDLTHTDKIVVVYQFEKAEPIVRLGDFVLNEPTQRFFRNKENLVGPYPIKDETDTRYWPEVVEARVVEPRTGLLTATISLTEVQTPESLHTGVFQGVWTPDDSVRYGFFQIYIYIKDKVTDTDFLCISAPQTITVIDRPHSSFIENNVIATPNDVKVVCTNIEQYINSKSQATRELTIRDALKMAHDSLFNYIGAKRYSYRQTAMLRQAEAIYAAYIILRSNLFIEQPLLDRYKKDVDDLIVSITKTLGYGSEEAVAFG